jgi:biopolymer transport protein ExbD/biopolymer transport protein TolR
MAFGRLERSAGAQPMSDINMTPLIDVMLVLLVIFMITAPLMSSSLKLELPRSDAAQPSDTPKFIAVAITPEGELFLGEEKLDASAFDERISAAARESPDIEVQLRADKRTPYGQVAELIGRVQKAGLNRIAFVTEAAEDAGAGAAPQR